MIEQELQSLSSWVGKILTENGLTIATAESCTGGLLSHVITGVSGSSEYFKGGVVAYSNQIKERFLGVQSHTLLQHGAVSAQTAGEMAAGIRVKFDTDFGLSTTGIAGPTGGTPTKPVGLVWLGISSQARTQTYEYHFEGERETIKASTVREILALLLDHLQQIYE